MNIRRYSFCLFICNLVTIIFFSKFSYASTTTFARYASPSNPVGSGARAMGKGGAFISTADDSTAASWNPAGLAQIYFPKFRVPSKNTKLVLPKSPQEFSMAWNNAYAKNTLSGTSELDSADNYSNTRLNYLSLVYPTLILNHAVVFSLNYQELYNFNRQSSYSFIENNPSLGLGANNSIEILQKGNLYAFSPAIGVNLYKRKLFLGGTLNIFDKEFTSNTGWERTYKRGRVGEDIVGTINSQHRITHRYHSIRGQNITLGILWKPLKLFSMGFVYKSNLKLTFTDTEKTRFRDSNNQTHSSTTDEDLEMRIPATYGLGFGFYPNDNWTVGIDIYRRDWADYYILSSDGEKRDPFLGRLKRDVKTKASYHVRLGTSYTWKDKRDDVPTVTIRGGAFYDPEPSKNAPDDFWGATAGFGIKFGKVCCLDLAYIFRWGNNVEGYPYTYINDSTVDIQQHQLMLSLIFFTGSNEQDSFFSF